MYTELDIRPQKLVSIPCESQGENTIMQKVMLAILVIAGCIGTARNSAAAAQGDGFAKFFAEFQAAVKAGDKEKVANMTSFDDFYWEATDATREIKTREAFLKNYERLFTPAIKNKIATAKPTKGADGYYDIIWHTASTQYGFDFQPQKDGSYKFKGYTVGPY